MECPSSSTETPRRKPARIQAWYSRDERDTCCNRNAYHERMKPEVRYARNGDVAIGYAVIGGGSDDDLVYLSPYNNLDIAWENPLYERFLRKLSSFARV